MIEVDIIIIPLMICHMTIMNFTMNNLEDVKISNDSTTSTFAVRMTTKAK